MIMGICLKLDVLVLLILAVSVTANWMRQYKYFIHGGCPAYSCKRVCMQNELLSVTPGDNGFYFEISEMNNQENYIPEKTYKCRLRECCLFFVFFFAFVSDIICYFTFAFIVKSYKILKFYFNSFFFG